MDRDSRGRIPTARSSFNLNGTGISRPYAIYDSPEFWAIAIRQAEGTLAPTSGLRHPTPVAGRSGPFERRVLKFGTARKMLRKTLQNPLIFTILNRLTARGVTTKIAILQGQFRGV
jgi:hypothetical protein